jgi:hypothetical protein
MFTQLNDFRKLSPPPVEALIKRNEQVTELKKQLGNKYLLATTIKKGNK